MKRAMLLILLGVLLPGMGLAHAHGIKVAGVYNAKWKEECGSCHLPYPPQFLTRGDWARLMGGLDKHFGDNAAIDPPIAQEILDFLERYAGRGAKYSAQTLRISDTPWFKWVHDEVPGRAWRDPAVKSPANCGACHVEAVRGDWSERNVRMPPGLGGEGDDD